MTFLEAAIAILQREGRPLHFKMLTEIALKDNLLTVVGRTPEATMQQRLNDALKKEDPHLMLVREKPGVFGLRFYPPLRGEAAPPEAPVNGTVPVIAEDSAGASEAARPEGAAGAPAASGGERRRRRRGGRGRGRRDATGATAAPSAEADADGDADSDGDAPVIAAAPPPPASDRAAHAVAEGQAAPSRRVRTSRADDDGDDDGPASPRRQPPLPGSPERRSFAEAAAVVAAAHRRRAEESATATAPGSGDSASPLQLDEPAPALAASAAAPAPVTVTPSPSAASPASSPPEEARLEDAAPEEEEEEFEHPSGPLIAPAFGTEELVRGEEHREPIEARERQGRGRDRERHRDRKKRGDKQRPEDWREARTGRPDDRRDVRAAPAPGAAAGPAPATPTPPPAVRAAPAPGSEARPGGELSPVEAAIEILRGGDGRPIHVRQIVEMALKRRLLRGEVADLIRVVRGGIIVDAREREATGLRPRVRATGGSNYQLADRRLDGELVQLERELSERASRLGEATRQALLRRLGKLPPHAFEALMRLLAARLGIVDVELVKRGDGVAYFGGERAAGAAGNGEPAARRRRVLLGIRSGDAELNRRSVGELRAGLKARNFDEGVLLSAGRIGDEALAEMGTSGGAVAVYDADELATLCVRHGVGTMRRSVPVDVLDIDLLGDLAEA